MGYINVEISLHLMHSLKILGIYEDRQDNESRAANNVARQCKEYTSTTED